MNYGIWSGVSKVMLFVGFAMPDVKVKFLFTDRFILN